MRRFPVPLLAAGILAAACGSSERTDLDEGPDHGGQTGSLLPTDGPQLSGLELLTSMPCSLAGSGDNIAVTEGDAALVVYPNANGDADVRLLDSEGNEVEVTVEDLDGSSAKLVRATQALSTGQYRLELDCDAGTERSSESTTVSVAPATSLPSSSGTLEPWFDPDIPRSCGESPWYAVRWTPAAELLPYQDLLALSISIAGAEPYAVVDYGQVNLSEDGTLTFRFPRCGVDDSDRCLPAEDVELSLFAEVAGETAQPSPATLRFRADCTLDPVSEDSCGFAASKNVGEANRRWWTWVLVFAAAWSRRRRAQRAASSSRGTLDNSSSR